MPATLKKLTSKTNRVVVTFDDDPDSAAAVEYSPRKMTGDMMESIAETMANDPNGVRAVVKQFLALVTAWDLAEDEGKPPIPLEEGPLMGVGIEILSDIMEAITADMSPKVQTESSSNGQ